MGVDSKLLVNQRFTVKHIEKLITEGLKLTITDKNYKGDHAFLTVATPDEDRPIWLYVAPSNEYGGLDSTLLSCRASDASAAFLRSIAKVLGGFFLEYDSGDDWEVFDDPHTGNARFILDHVILTKAISKGANIADKVADATGYYRK